MITYTWNGEYLVPHLIIEEADRQIGKYGLMCKAYLKEHRTAKYNALLLSGSLTSYLIEIDQTANRQIAQAMDELTRSDPPPDKQSDPQAWTRHRNTLRQQAEERILSELIYS